MKVGFVLPLACALVLKSSLDTSGSLTVDACKLGFSRNIYTVFMPRKQLQGHTVVKVKFEACHLNERIRFESSDPKFSVRPDGSLYAEQDMTDLSKPIEFMVTARGSKDTQVWTTVVQLVIARHSHHHPPRNKLIVQKVNSHQNHHHHHHHHHHNLSQLQQDFSFNGLHWKTKDCFIPPISAPENFRRASSLFPARFLPQSVSIMMFSRDPLLLDMIGALV